MGPKSAGRERSSFRQKTTPAGLAGVLVNRIGKRLRLGGFALDFLEAGGLAAQSADVEQLGTADLVAANLLDLVDNLGVEGEDTLDALAKAHLAHRKGALRPAVDGDDQAFKRLQA